MQLNYLEQQICGSLQSPPSQSLYKNCDLSEKLNTFLHYLPEDSLKHFAERHSWIVSELTLSVFF